MRARQIAAFAIGPIGGAALALISLPLVAWIYTPEDVGRLNMAQLASTFSMLLFSLGLDQVYVREYHEAPDKSALLRAAVLPGATILIIALAIGLSIPGFISRTLFAVSSFHLSLLMALAMLSVFFTRFLSLIFRMQEDGLAFSLSQILSKAIFLLVILAYLGMAVSADLTNLVVAHSSALFAACALLAWNTRHAWAAMMKATIDRKQLREMLRIGTPLIVSGAAYWGLTALSRLFLRGYSSFEELGIYAVAASFAGAAVIIQNVFSTIWAPLVYKWSTTGIDTLKIDQVTEGVIYAIVALFGLAGLASTLVTFILPPQYVRVQYLLVACMAHPLFYTLSETTVVGIGLQRKSVYAMTASIAGLFAAAVTSYLLVPQLGADGAAISMAVAFWFFLFCRTELAIVAWRPLPRARIYGWTLLCLGGAVGFVMLGARHPLLFAGFWTVLLATALKLSVKPAKAYFVEKRLQNSRDA